jgi:hypothetical protein
MTCGQDLSTTNNLQRHFQTCHSRQITKNIILKHEEHQRELRDLREQHERELCVQREYYERKLCELSTTITSQSDDNHEDVVDEYPWHLVLSIDMGESEQSQNTQTDNPV